MPKRVGSHTYVHRSAVRELPAEQRQRVRDARRIARRRATGANVYKIGKERVSFLHYRDFDRTRHPRLERGVVVRLSDRRVRLHRVGKNPPVLHRKELFVSSRYPHRQKFARQTRQAERRGYYQGGTRTIGTRRGHRERQRSLTLSANPSLALFATKHARKDVETANKTDRSRGAVGKRAIVPRVAAKTARKGQRVLDYGAGKNAIHARQLRRRGHNVTAHDYGRNVTKHHDPKALRRKYHLVYASNVLNVQRSRRGLNRTLDEIAGATRRGGTAIVNYPKSPRKMTNLSEQSLERSLRKRFRQVEREKGGVYRGRK